MKLKETGSMTNYLMGNSKSKLPEVGMGATQLWYTDREAYTIIEVLKTKKGAIKGIRIQQDKAIRTDNNGMSESQEYRYEPNPNGEIKVATLRPNGQYRLPNTKYTDSKTVSKGAVVLVGVRDAYHDYSF